MTVEIDVLELVILLFLVAVVAYCGGYVVGHKSARKERVEADRFYQGLERMEGEE